jgi:hypothetical protein
MHDLFMFVASICFVVVALPVLQTISDIVCGFGQWIISTINVHVITNNVKSQELQSPQSTQAIGFEAPLNDSDQAFEEDPEEDKIHIGFRG